MKLQRIPFLLAGTALLMLSACSTDDESPSDLDQQLSTLLDAAAGGNGAAHFTLPDSDDYNSIPQDANNPITADKVVLGKLLFHETAIATQPKLVQGAGTYSCASCHHAKAGFQAGNAQGIGEGGIGFGLNGESRNARQDYPVAELDIQPLRSPTVLNVAYQELMLWNGQFGANGANSGTDAYWTPGSPKEDNNFGFDGVETQAIAGLKVHRLQFEESPVAEDATYRALYDAAFASVPPADRYDRIHTGLAVAAYERTLLANRAPFQRWLRGERNAMTEVQKRGAILFFDKGGCASCHNGPALNSMEFYALGMKDLDQSGEAMFGEVKEADRKGRGGFTTNPADDYKFKVPQLYNLRDVPFYGHGASFGSMQALIEYKNLAVAENNLVPAAQLATEFTPLALTEEEVQELVAFVEDALYDPNLDRYLPAALPSGNCFPNNDPQSRSDLGCD